MLRKLMNRRDAMHELVVITVSYAFIFAGAWNDGLLGFPPSIWSVAAEWTMAAALLAEVVSRIAFTERRGTGFWGLVALDFASVLTVFPGFAWITFARVGRMLYAAGRLMRFLDRLAAERDNGMYITGIFPFVVPVLAAVVYSAERHTRGSPVHNIYDALRMCFAFSLTLGNVRPVSDIAKVVCGALFLLGLLTIGVLTNAISARYQKDAIAVSPVDLRGTGSRGRRYRATRDSLSSRS
jgi:hypothetical protein